MWMVLSPEVYQGETAPMACNVMTSNIVTLGYGSQFGKLAKCFPTWGAGGAGNQTLYRLPKWRKSRCSAFSPLGKKVHSFHTHTHTHTLPSEEALCWLPKWEKGTRSPLCWRQGRICTLSMLGKLAKHTVSTPSASQAGEESMFSPLLVAGENMRPLPPWEAQSGGRGKGHASPHCCSDSFATWSNGEGKGRGTPSWCGEPAKRAVSSRRCSGSFVLSGGGEKLCASLAPTYSCVCGGGTEGHQRLLWRWCPWLFPRHTIP